jgi:uncharacterized protein YukE
VSRRLVVLGTSVTLPDPASVTDLAVSFQQQGGQLADLQTTLQSLTRPDAWGDWTGLAADAFGQTIGQLPAELGDARDAYDDVASALRQYAGQLEPVINSLISLSYQAEDAEGTLAAVQDARSRAIATGHNPVTTGWDARLTDATEAVSALRGQLNRLLAELTALAATCTKRIKAAEPRTAGKSLFGELESDFVRDVADPMARAAKEAFKLDMEAVKLGAEAAGLEVIGAAAMFEALWVHPVTNLFHDVTGHLDAEKLGLILGDVAGVLGIVALLPIPGVDVVAGLAALAIGGVGAGLDWWAAAHHEEGASYLQAGLATVSVALTGVGMVAKAGAGAVDAAGDLDDGADAAKSGGQLWAAGLKRTFTPAGIEDSIRNEQIDKDLAEGDAPTGVRGFGQALFDNVRDKTIETFTVPSGDDASSPAAVTMVRVGWATDRLNDVTNTVQDIEGDKTESLVP